jgi:hypothetical protein
VSATVSEAFFSTLGAPGFDEVTRDAWVGRRDENDREPTCDLAHTDKGLRRSGLSEMVTTVIATIQRRPIMSAKSKIAAAVAGALFLVANGASAQHRANSQVSVRHLPGAFQPTYGYVPRQVSQHGVASDVYSSDSLGRQSFANPDRDFSIENLRSHPSH